jgi:hypothetical protein
MNQRLREENRVYKASAELHVLQLQYESAWNPDPETKRFYTSRM